MDIFSNLALGFNVAFSPMNLGLCLIGALVGTLVGVLPGIGTIATVAMLLPITFGLPPVGALIMLAGIYYGAQYGGSTTSILVNIPARRPPWSPRSTVFRWPSRAGRVRRSPSPLSARSSPAVSRPS